MPSSRPIGLIGTGQLGGVFARGLLRLGRTIVPINRDRSPKDLTEVDPELVLTAVGEDSLPSVLDALPRSLKGRVALVQNELVPATWKRLGVVEPTVCVVWFEKKAGRALHTVLPTEIAGPAADLLSDALSELAIPNHVIAEGALPLALVRKNLYILTLNLGGLRFDTSAADLWHEHADFARALARELIMLQSKLVGDDLPTDELLESLERAIDADPAHGCRGRSAATRLARARAAAAEHHLELPVLATLASLPE